MSNRVHQPKPIVLVLLATLALSVAFSIQGNEIPPATEYVEDDSEASPLKLDRAMPDLSLRHDRPATPVIQKSTDEDLALNQLNQKLQYLEEKQAELQTRYAKLLSANNKTSGQPTFIQWPYAMLAFVMLGSLTIWGWRRRIVAGSKVAQGGPESIPPETVELVDPISITTHEESLLDSTPGQSELLVSQNQPETQNPGDIRHQIAAMIAQGNPHLAIQLLENSIRKLPEASPLPWLLLLELLHRDETRARYEYKRRQCQLYFNVDLPEYGSKLIETKGIESYPHVMAELIRLWPGEGIVSYLDSLLLDERDGTRLGFNISAYNDILLLHAIVHGSAAGN